MQLIQHSCFLRGLRDSWQGPQLGTKHLQISNQKHKHRSIQNLYMLTNTHTVSFSFSTKMEGLKSLKSFRKLKHYFVGLTNLGQNSRCHFFTGMMRSLDIPVIHLPTDIIRVVPMFLWSHTSDRKAFLNLFISSVFTLKDVCLVWWCRTLLHHVCSWAVANFL